MKRTTRRQARLLALLLAPTLTLACAKDKGKDTDPPELELPPENKVADKSGKGREDETKSKQDEQVAAKKVEPSKGEPKVVHPQDRDQDQEKLKMKRSRDKSAKAKQLLRSGKNDKAIAEARDALREHEQNVEAMLVIAEAFYKQGKHELVLSVTGSILKVDAKILTPEEKSQAYNLMGFAYLQAGKRIDAFSAFKNAAETDANNASAWNNLGVQYMWRGDSKTAESCFEYAVSLDAKFAEAQLNWGAALRANGKLAEAQTAFEQASKLRPDWAEVHFNLGVLYLDAEQMPNLDEIARLDAAIAEFEKYKGLVAKGGSSLEDKPKKKSRGASDAMGNELVSVAQADLYIKAANKGIESEERRKQREQKRKEREAKKAAEAKEAEAEDAAAEQPADDQPQQPGGEQPPQPQEPGAKPSEPAQPSQPAQPKKPGSKPEKPDGDEPADPPSSEKPQAPAKPQAPQKPQPQKPKTQKPGG